MTILMLGLGLFFAIHFFAVMGGGVRASLIEKLGKGPYRGLYSLLAAGSFYLIYLGWTGTIPEAVYTPAAGAFHVTPVFVLLGFVLFFASRAPTNIKRFIRHPQLMGVSFWAAGHLLANGEQRSLLLFGSFLIWAQLMIVVTNRRDGAWQKPERQPVVKDIITVTIGVVLFVGFIMIHEWLIGVRPMM